MFLDRIVTTKHEEVAQLQARTTIAEMEKIIAALPPTLGFERALGAGRQRSMGLIAEVKKASPSKGLIREDFEPVSLARAYEQAGADCISVLTDVQYFQGANEYLTRVREAVNVPLLRKDFTIDPYQIYEARCIGADAILLIAAILTTEQMREYQQTARSIGLDVLIEVHDKEELDRVLELSPTMVGINNRNLRTFVTDLHTTEELIQYIPKDVTVVSESGISRSEEITYLESIGARAVLVGEHFMRQESVGRAVDDLLGVRPEASASREL
ncbi:Indole-3-glycerol-phosphate synthase [Paenibacillus mucilaginosus 3016]|uniref:Indole-3-glycerol phosphate synthase n=1 Tax=Paenibacillus mucilaginosus 3016 TaxID=1116391 RepID=H6NAH8_9BACL|nr:indole-3-glycerol phosphate synthase TrpC [Paenibacillus mucilaginosus]AFC29903.1 Indole-3-glycerol-phosphate synthase [Paenibacillus mucilaginosus 3016]WFA18564.1 indole-3-glycerol phosphate synthase TrpC [Paenibacillus mucilaginosus]